MIRQYYILGLFYFVMSCTAPTNTPELINGPLPSPKDTVHPDEPLPSFIQESFYHSFEEEKEPYSYCCDARKDLSQWVDQLPDKIRSKIIWQELLVEKIYYLSDPDDKQTIQAVLNYDHALEQHLYVRIGMAQGAYSVIFSTQMVSAKKASPTNGEGFLLRLNQYRYHQKNSILEERENRNY